MKTKEWLSIICAILFFTILLGLENYDLNQKLNNIPKQNQNKYFEDCKKRWFDFWLPLEYKQGHKTFEEFYGTVSQYVWKECKVFY